MPSQKIYVCSALNLTAPGAAWRGARIADKALPGEVAPRSCFQNGSQIGVRNTGKYTHQLHWCCCRWRHLACGSALGRTFNGFNLADAKPQFADAEPMAFELGANAALEERKFLAPHRAGDAYDEYAVIQRHGSRTIRNGVADSCAPHPIRQWRKHFRKPLFPARAEHTVYGQRCRQAAAFGSSCHARQRSTRAGRAYCCV
jgi:hypothetical protein